MILTDEEIVAIAKQYDGNPITVEFWYARAIEQAIIQKMNSAIHYPECWDTAAYPTVADAFAEVFVCSNDDCPHPPAPSDRELQHEHSMKQFQEVCNGRNCYSSKARPSHSEECKADHDACYATAPSVVEWISVDDRLPTDGTYLCRGHAGTHFICLMRNGRWFRQSAAKVVVGILHWMPLPQPPVAAARSE